MPLPTPSSLSAFGEAHDLALEIGEGDRTALALRLALPVVGDLVAVPGLDVAVDAVEADVELAADVPLRVRQVPLVELLERLEPGDALAALGLPELLEVAVVDLGLRIGLGGELRRRRVPPLLEQEGVDRMGAFRHSFPSRNVGWRRIRVLGQETSKNGQRRMAAIPPTTSPTAAALNA